MSLHRFFLPEQRIANEPHKDFILALSEQDKHHARVLRLEVGERIAIIDADQNYFVCEIVSLEENDIRVQVTQRTEQQAPKPHVVVVQGLTKSDKMEMVIRQTTELGVSAFVPYCATRSVVKLDNEGKVDRKVKRWQLIAKSAAMQSGQRKIPTVFAPQTFEQLIETMQDGDAIAVCWEEASGTGIASFVHERIVPRANAKMDAKIYVVIGPEGGLTNEEVSAICDTHDNAAPITLGSSILRTETAGVIAPALILHELGAL